MHTFLQNHGEIAVLALMAALKGVEWANLPPMATVAASATIGYFIGRSIRLRMTRH